MDRILKAARESGSLNLSNRPSGQLALLISNQCFDLLRFDIEIGSSDEAVELHKLILAHNSIEVLKEDLRNLPQLTVLNISHNKLTHLPQAVGQLPLLKLLDLSFNSLVDIPEEIGSATSLVKFDCSNNQLKELPCSLGKCLNMSDFKASNNSVICLPEDLMNWSKLAKLDVEGNKLTTLSEKMVASWGMLTELNASKNLLNSIPESIGNLSRLIRLDLHQNRISNIPSSIRGCSMLAEFYMGNNKLSALPAEIGELSHLGTFDLHSNQLKEFPVEACKLRLAVLDLSNNSLSGLPAEIGNMTTLRRLLLVGNPMRSLRSSLVSGPTTTLLKYLRSRLSAEEAGAGSATSVKEDIIVRATRMSISSKELSLQNLGLTVVPSDVWESNDITKLDLSKNSFEELPVSFLLVQISRNKIREWPSAILNSLPSLICLKLDNNPLKQIPADGLSALQSLQILDLSGNAITLPRLSSLQQLQELYLRRMQLQEVSSDILSLRQLRILDLSQNCLQSISEGFKSLSCLNELDLSDNNISSLPAQLGFVTIIYGGVERDVSFSRSCRRPRESFDDRSNAETVMEDEEELMWAALSRLPSQKRTSTALIRRSASEARDGEKRTETVDVTNLSRSRRELVYYFVIDMIILFLLCVDNRAGLEIPKVEVRFQNLNVTADVQVGSRALPTLVNYTRDMAEYLLTSVGLFRPKKLSLTIVNDVMLCEAWKKSGDVTYNGHRLDEFYAQRTAAYISQTDNHIAEITVRETFDFAARCQGASDIFSGVSPVAKEKELPQCSSMPLISLELGDDVGPRKALFMDEISTGLDSSTTYQIVKCLGNFVHLMDATVLVALLQPAPETFNLFDDLILLSEGQILYHGPRADVLEFFDSLGFRSPPRKGVADFLQEVTSKNDQAQYWADSSKPYTYISSSQIAEAFKNSRFGKSVNSTLSVPYDRQASHPSALAKTKTCQVAFVGFITCTVFLRTRLHPTDEANANLYLSALFFGLVHMMFNGISELSIMISRLPVFYKQRDNYFHPAWSWAISSWILRLPYSVLEAVIWSCVVYYSVGLAPSAGRFFRYMLLLFAIHQMALGLFRMMASLARDIIIANTFGSAALFIIFLMGGFIIPKGLIKPWWSWAFWVSPLSYGQRAISINEFAATRWLKKSMIADSSVGINFLRLHSLPYEGYWYWLGIGVLLAYGFLFNAIMTLALAYLNPIKKAQSLPAIDDTQEGANGKAEVQRSELYSVSTKDGVTKRGMILPFEPMTMTFHNVNYFVDMPKEMSDKGVPEKKLQLLSGVSGVFSPGVLTALVGSSGAGKTTLMDVLAGRKTGGYIEGDIRISGYPKEQRTFARISGYVEQNDIHSPQVTVEESLWFSSILRLPKEVSKEKKREFVEEVMKLVELDSLRNALVGLPGSSGLSTEQRKRLTIAVELVANPSIIFMDEPTSGLDARAAAIVMRTVRNTVDTGRTVVCTIHQPSIDIFEAFDELLLMKRGGRVIYGGKLGEHSQTMINYFLKIEGVPHIPDGYNPATWMLEISTPAAEERYGADLADVYKNSEQYREVEASIKSLSVPTAGSQRLKFSTMDTTQDLFTVMGALYSSCLFLGISNASTVQPIISIERTVFYRERAAGMYSPYPYAFAQGLVEIPYIILQTILYGVITFFMINFERTAKKFFLYLVFMFLTFTYFTFYGMMAIGLTPSQQMAAVVSSAFYSLWNLLSGFLIPKPSIPGWWIWFYYICPIAWTLKGIIISQLGDVEDKIVGPGFEGSVKEYLKVSLGYEYSMMGYSAAVLIGFSFLFFGTFAVSLRLLNFQRR
ncbi:unnamed protein product [Rhodiola kirilowii]